MTTDDKARCDLALEILAIANDARLHAMKHGMFRAGDWRTFDHWAESATVFSAAADDAKTSMCWAAQWSMRPGEYANGMAGLFDRMTALLTNAEKIAA